MTVSLYLFQNQFHATTTTKTHIKQMVINAVYVVFHASYAKQRWHMMYCSLCVINTTGGCNRACDSIAGNIKNSTLKRIRHNVVKPFAIQYLLMWNLRTMLPHTP